MWVSLIKFCEIKGEGGIKLWKHMTFKRYFKQSMKEREKGREREGES